MPASAVSSGNVTRRSISTGESDASRTLICTWRFVMSGTASMESRRAASTPASATRRTVTTTVTRWRIEMVRMRWSMIRSVGVAGLALRELGLHEKRAVGRDALAGREAGRDLRRRAADAPENDGTHLEPLALRHEHDGAPAVGVERAL